MNIGDRDCHQQEVLVIGCGAAGMTLALCLAGRMSVTILAKGDVSDSSTWQAQGGIAAALDDSDDTGVHLEDTLRAGAGLCRADRVEELIKAGPAAVRWLVDAGVVFDTEADTLRFHLAREGGHSRRRIVHAADATGKAIVGALHERIREQAERHDDFRILSDRIAIDLVTAQVRGRRTCVGAHVFNCGTGRVEVFRASCVVLATGGASTVYLYTSNPDGSTGDGIAMAWRAGCRVADMEFTQFHPTSLYWPEGRSVLISEAVRGEGGRLLLQDGEGFMGRFHEKAELAPRDVVARAIDHEMKRLGDDYVLLDISHRPADFVARRFPNIMRACRERGIDITREPLPVVPAAHYTCGGVVVDMLGRTDLQGLYAIGETTCTGVHGANRIASNSLLECVVCGRGAAADILGRVKPHQGGFPVVLPRDESRIQDSDEDIVIAHNWRELRRFMWDYVGIVRSNKRLLRAVHRVELLAGEIDEFYRNYRISAALVELRNMVTVAELIIRSARLRTESRGLHYNLDYPRLAGEAVHTILTPKAALAGQSLSPRPDPQSAMCDPI